MCMGTNIAYIMDEIVDLWFYKQTADRPVVTFRLNLRLQVAVSWM